MNPEAEDLQLPPEPDRPDCCNGGCAVCVLEGFDDELRAWWRACDEIRAKRALLSPEAVAPAAAVDPGQRET